MEENNFTKIYKNFKIFFYTSNTRNKCNKSSQEKNNKNDTIDKTYFKRTRQTHAIETIINIILYAIIAKVHTLKMHVLCKILLFFIIELSQAHTYYYCNYNTCLSQDYIVNTFLKFFKR